jgi:hypothetical protein
MEERKTAIQTSDESKGLAKYATKEKHMLTFLVVSFLVKRDVSKSVPAAVTFCHIV